MRPACVFERGLGTSAILVPKSATIARKLRRDPGTPAVSTGALEPADLQAKHHQEVPCRPRSCHAGGRGFVPSRGEMPHAGRCGGDRWTAVKALVASRPKQKQQEAVQRGDQHQHAPSGPKKPRPSGRSTRQRESRPAATDGDAR